jgi:DNA polymerase III subunit beta
MNLTIAKEQLISGLQAVQNIVATRTSLPILSNVLLQAQENQLHLTATDLDVTITSTVEAQVKTPGAITLPVKKLFGIARELGHSELDLELGEKNACTIQSGPSFYKILGLPAEEFPPLPRFKEERKVNLPQEKIRGMLRKTSFATSSDESRYVLNGIFLSLKEHKLTMVATDGRRLALAEEEVDVSEKSQGEIIVPTKAVNELNRLLQDKGEMELKFSENQAAFHLTGDKGSTLLITKLIEGSYPNYRQVIPAETRERIALVREEFLHALRRAEIMTSDKANSVKLSLSRNNLAITANAPELGEARESIAINYKGKEMAVAFNPAYIIEPLNALSEEEVYLELIDELSPGVLKINGPYLYVVMPMRLS